MENKRALSSSDEENRSPRKRVQPASPKHRKQDTRQPKANPTKRIHVHKPRQCPICLLKGIDAVFKRPGAHVKKMHGLAAEEAWTMMSEQRALAGKNSKGERNYYRCGLCQKCLIDRQQHLRQQHEITDIRSYEYVMGMDKFTRVQKRTHPETAEKILGVAYATPAPPAPLAPTAADSGSAPTPDERTKTSTASSGIAMPPTQFAEDDENTAGLPYLTKDYCLSLAPHARVMQGRQNFHIVTLYVQHLASRIGGSADRGKRQETAMKINRFLALIGYIEGQPLDSVLSWQGHLTVHDDYFLSKGHSPGTLRSALLAIRPFLRWCKDEGHATQHKAEQAERMLQGCDTATRREVRKREVQLRVEESTSIPLDPELPQNFYESQWVRKTIEEFEAWPALAYKDMRGIIIAMIALRNATRTGEFVHLQMKHVHKAVPFGNSMDNMSIRLETHKTALSGKFAYLHMTKKVYQWILGYCKVVIKDQQDGEQYVFGDGDADARNNAVNRWLQKAWANAGMQRRYPGFVMSLTNNRKRLTGLVRTEDPTKAAPMAAYMKHNQSTADRYYAVHEQLKQSEKMYLFVDHVQSKKNRYAALPSAAAAPLVPEVKPGPSVDPEADISTEDEISADDMDNFLGDIEDRCYEARQAACTDSSSSAVSTDSDDPYCPRLSSSQRYIPATEVSSDEEHVVWKRRGNKTRQSGSSSESEHSDKQTNKEPLLLSTSSMVSCPNPGSRSKISPDEETEIKLVFADDIESFARADRPVTVSMAVIRKKRTAKLSLLDENPLREKVRNLSKRRRLQLSRECANLSVAKN